MLKRRIRELIGKIRFAILSCLAKKRIKSRSFSAISFKAKNTSFNGGTIDIGKKVGIEDGCYLSAVNDGSIVIEDGVFINRNFIATSHGKIQIGAGTVVKQSIPDHTLVTSDRELKLTPII